MESKKRGRYQSHRTGLLCPVYTAWDTTAVIRGVMHSNEEAMGHPIAARFQQLKNQDIFSYSARHTLPLSPHIGPPHGELSPRLYRAPVA